MTFGKRHCAEDRHRLNVGTFNEQTVVSKKCAGTLYAVTHAKDWCPSRERSTGKGHVMSLSEQWPDLLSPSHPQLQTDIRPEGLLDAGARLRRALEVRLHADRCRKFFSLPAFDHSHRGSPRRTCLGCCAIASVQPCSICAPFLCATLLSSIWETARAFVVNMRALKVLLTRR